MPVDRVHTTDRLLKTQVSKTVSIASSRQYDVTFRQTDKPSNILNSTQRTNWILLFAEVIIHWNATVEKARDLDIVVDSQFTMLPSSTLCADQRTISCVTASVTWPVVRSLSVDAAKMMVQTFVLSRLNYCNCFILNATASGSPERRCTYVWSPLLRNVTTSFQFSNNFIGFHPPTTEVQAGGVCFQRRCMA